MKTFGQPGEFLTLTAPSGGVVSGSAYLIGDMLVVAMGDADQDLPFEGAVKGVVILPRVDSEDWAEGDKLYWDDGAKVVTSDDASASNPLIGIAITDIAASPAEATGPVRLDGAVR